MSGCPCGHDWPQHAIVEGRYGLADVLVCAGGRLADVNHPDFHPYDLACGCCHSIPTHRVQIVRALLEATGPVAADQEKDEVDASGP